MQNQSGFAPIQIILSILAGTIILGGIVGGVLYLRINYLWQTRGECGDGICSVIEENKMNCLQDCQQQEEKKDEAIQKTQSQNAGPFLEEINFHYLASGKNFGNILKLFNPVIDEVNRKMYVVGSKTTAVGVIDLNKDELVETFDMGVPGGFLIFNNQKLYSFEFSNNKCFLIDIVQKKSQSIDVNTCTSIAPKKSAVKWGNYSFMETGYQSFPDGTTGFRTDWAQDLNGAYGIIEISDSSGKKVGKIIHGPDALYFDIDDTTGKLYTTNTGDGSISIFDLNKLESTDYCQNNSCWIKEIDIGNSADDVIVDSSGNLYVRNRLGGSVIYKYNTESKKFTIINNENHESGGISMWPTDMKLNKDEKRLYVLSHYGALIDVVDTTTNKVINKIKFTISLKPRTDSISAMAVDKSRDRIYAVWPETGIIGVADGAGAKVVGTIDLTKYGFDKSKAANAGPGLVNIAVNEKKNKLYVDLYNEKKILVFNGDTLAKENEASLTTDKKRHSALFSNDDKDVIYLNNKIINATTLKETSTFSKGYVVAFNNGKDAVYLVDMISAGPGKQQEKIYEFSDNKYVKEWSLDVITGGVASNFYFDFKNSHFYAAYFTDGKVKKYDLNAGSTPTTGSSSSVPAVGSSQNSGGTSSTSCDLNKDGKVDSTEQKRCGSSSSNSSQSNSDTPSGLNKCGDGVCETAEKTLCPTDCK